MQISIFQTGIQKIQTVLGKKIEKDLADLLWEKLLFLDDRNFSRIVNEYISELSPPRNILGYLLSRGKQTQPPKQEFSAPVIDLPFDKEHSDFLGKIVGQSYRLARQKKFKIQDAWLSDMYRSWATLPKFELTHFLESKQKQLYDLEAPCP